MTPSKRALVLVVVTLVTQGCYIDFKRPSGPQVVAVPLGRKHQQAGQNSLGTGFGQKRVEGKRPPTRLIAQDGTSCTVSRKKYDSTVLGSPVWCTWFDTNR